MIAVPDGVDTTEFLRRTGWAEVADSREEGLFVLEPGPTGWSGAVDEADYLDAAMSFYQSNGYFSIFGLHYFDGYGAGAAALEAWAVAHPLRVICQVYVDSPGLDAGEPFVLEAGANDTGNRSRSDRTLGTVYAQRRGSDRWMTSYAGPIAQVAVQRRPVVAHSRAATRQSISPPSRRPRHRGTGRGGHGHHRRRPVPGPRQEDLHLPDLRVRRSAVPRR